MNDELIPIVRKLFDMQLPAQAQAGAEAYAMAPRDKTLMRDLRYVMRENQTQFWQRFGVAQTSGSRFERGTAMPMPLLLLMRLYFLRRIGDADLQAVRSPEYGRSAVLIRAESPAPCGSP